MRRATLPMWAAIKPSPGRITRYSYEARFKQRGPKVRLVEVFADAPMNSRKMAIKARRSTGGNELLGR